MLWKNKYLRVSKNSDQEREVILYSVVGQVFLLKQNWNKGSQGYDKVS